MDMAMRSFVLVAALALTLAAALIGWLTLGGGDLTLSGFGGREDRTGTITVRDASDGALSSREGSLRNEFGEGGLTVRSGGSGQSSVQGSRPVDWSGDPGAGSAFDLPRGTPDERVESDCRVRGYSDFACRCLVRRAKETLGDEAYLLLSLAYDDTAGPDRLQASGLSARDHARVSAEFAALHVEALRHCSAGLVPPSRR
ncbi:MAG: hypothetical protein ACOC0V_03590 [Oceanicaulis sp.]